MKPIIRLFAAVIVLAIIASCGNGNRKPLLPNVSGKAGEVVVAMDRENWEGALGNQARELLAGDCPYLVMQEPMFALVNISPTGFPDMFKIHRNIVFFDFVTVYFKVRK